MMSGTNVATSRGVKSWSFSFFGFVTVPKKTRWYSHSRYAAANTTPGTAHATHLQFSMNVPQRIVYSPMNPFSSGNPIDDRNIIIVIVA